MEKCLVHQKIARQSICRGNDCILKGLIQEAELGDFKKLHKAWGTKRIINILEEQPVHKRRQKFEVLVQKTMEFKQGEDELLKKDSSQNRLNDGHRQDNHSGSQFLSGQTKGFQSGGAMERTQHFLGARNEFLGIPHQNPQGVQSNAFLEGVPLIESRDWAHRTQQQNLNCGDEFLAAHNSHANRFLAEVSPVDDRGFHEGEKGPTNDEDRGFLEGEKVLTNDLHDASFEDHVYWIDNIGGLEDVMPQFQNGNTETGTEGFENERGIDYGKHAERSSGVAGTVNGGNLTEDGTGLNSTACGSGTPDGLQLIERNPAIQSTGGRRAICDAQQQIEFGSGMINREFLLQK